jgi:rare lipoprotein A
MVSLVVLALGRESDEQKAERAYTGVEVQVTATRPPPPAPKPVAPHVTSVTPQVTGQWVSCKASWYEYGQLTASGERFDEEAMTCAHRRLRFGAVIEVRRGDRVIHVRVNDRGPAKWTGRDIDLSKGAFRRLAPLSRGVIEVRYRVIKETTK